MVLRDPIQQLALSLILALSRVGLCLTGTILVISIIDLEKTSGRNPGKRVNSSAVSKENQCLCEKWGFLKHTFRKFQVFKHIYLYRHRSIMKEPDYCFISLPRYEKHVGTLTSLGVVGSFRRNWTVSVNCLTNENLDHPFYGLVWDIWSPKSNWARCFVWSTNGCFF